MSFIGWLHTAVRKDSRALALFADAEGLADEAGDGTIAATAASFRGTWPACRASRVAANQQDAEWINEYHQALAYASERA